MSLTIKQAFEALSDACANGMKNPFLILFGNLYLDLFIVQDGQMVPLTGYAGIL